MTLWLILTVMTAAAAFAVIWPLTRRAAAARSGNDMAVYRDQLEEVERDLGAGLIGTTEAQAARIELSRRLLAAADADRAADTAAPATAAAGSILWRRRAAAIATVVALPVIAGSLYLRLGSPELASAQAAAQAGMRPGPRGAVAAADPSVQSLIAQAEAHLASNPDDGRAWEVLAPVYMRLDRYSDSVSAWRNVVRLLGENAERDSDLGESLMAEANGVVTAEAKAAFVRAASLDDTLVSPRYYLGLAAEQDGRRQEAATIWRELIDQAPPGAEWVGEVRQSLARVESKTVAPPAPTAAQVASAAKEPPEQQTAMIQTMVDRLAARLKQDGSDPAGWAQLIRSYNVLGQADKARAASVEAQQALASDASKLDQLNAALKGGDANTVTVAAATPPAPAAAPNATPVPGRSLTQTAGADQPAPAQHDIQSMVDRLAARLKQDGSDVAGWLQLIRSYKVLGQADKAQAATADARQALAGDPTKLEQFNTALKTAEAPPPAAPAAPADADKTAPDQPAGTPPDHQQAAAMQTMIEHLAERLKTSGSDPAGWLMLVRSYLTVGQKDKATAAIGDARHALAGDPATLDQFNKALKNYKIDE